MNNNGRATMAFLFLFFLLYFFYQLLPSTTYTRGGETLNRSVRIYPAIPLSLLPSRCGYTSTAGNIGRVTGNQPPSLLRPAFQPPFYTGRRQGIFKALPSLLPLPSLLSGGVEFHGIPLILGEINIDTGGFAMRRWCNYFMVHFYFFLLFSFLYSYQTAAVLIFILVDFGFFGRRD